MSCPMRSKNRPLEIKRLREIREYKMRLCPDFPVRALPEYVFSAIDDTHYAAQSPFQLCVSTVLSFMSAVAQGECDVRVTEGLSPKPVSLFFITGAVSGDRKTGTEKWVFPPLHDHDRQVLADYDAELEQHQVDLILWKTKNKKLEKELGKLPENSEEYIKCEAKFRLHLKNKPKKPVRRQMIFNDTTYRGMTEALPEHNASACLLSSEAGSSMKKQTQSQLPELNSMWDGGDIAINRVAGRRTIRSPRMTLHWMVQLEYAEKLLFSPDSMVRPSGFAARICFCFPPSIQGSRQRTPGADGPELEGLKQLQETARRLLQKQRSGKNERVVLTIQDRYHLDQLYNDIEDELGPDGEFAEYRDAGSKLLENIIRMAAIFHVFSDEYAQGSLEISTRYIEAAREICSWYMRQFMAAFRPDAPAIRNAYKLMDWLDERENRVDWRGGFACSRLIQLVPGIRSRALLEAAIDVINELYPNDYFFEHRRSDGKVMYIYTKNQWFSRRPQFAPELKKQ